MIRRILMATINYDHPQLGMEHAMRGMFGSTNVMTFDSYDLRRKRVGAEVINYQFVERAAEFRPDWIWLQVQDSELLTADTVRQVRECLPTTVVSHWTGDLRPTVSPYLASFCRECDLTLISSKGQIPLFERAGARRVAYCQIGVDWEEDVLGIRALASPIPPLEVAFCANYYPGRFPGTQDRVNAVLALRDAGIRVGIVGTGWPPEYPVVGRCHVKEQVHAYQRSLIALSVNHFNDVSLYYSDRQLIAMASGVPVLCKYVPGLEAEFENGVELLWYENTEQLVDLARRLLSSEEQRASIGRRGRAAVMRRHTWWNRFLNILPIVEEIAGVRAHLMTEQTDNVEKRD